jgi:tetratricopeptide (TPR) repeat protein
MTRLSVCVWAIAALLPNFVSGQQVSAASTLQGRLLDAQGKPVAAGRVELKTGGQTISVTTDAEGKYRFSALHADTYSLRAESGTLQADSGPIVLGERESKSVDLTLVPADKTPFFDPPSFIVAGVTDSANRGGHGSDPVRHSTEALVKATASLASGAVSAGDLEAAQAYQQAAERDPSEPHIFDWGAELLVHRAAEQAVEVFSQGNKLFPRSTRMLSGLAAAWYSRGEYDRAQQFFFEATDLNPADPAPYLLLGRVRNSSIGQSAGFAERMARFQRLHPENAWANYYYAIDLRPTAPSKAQALLDKAVRIDPRLGAAWLQLGILLADQSKFHEAISAWQRALAADADDATAIEAHYRLSQAWGRAGDLAKAKSEIETYQRLSKQSAEAEERERASVREFVFKLRVPAPASQ